MLKRHTWGRYAYHEGDNAVFIWGGDSTTIDSATLLLPLKISLTDYSVTTLNALPPALDNPNFFYHNFSIYVINRSMVNGGFTIYRYVTISNTWEVFKTYTKTPTMLFDGVTMNNLLSGNDVIYAFCDTCSVS